MLNSREAQPFWDELDRIYAQYMAMLRRDRSGELTHALDALDKVCGITGRHPQKKPVDGTHEPE